MHEGTRCTLLDPLEDARVLDVDVDADADADEDATRRAMALAHVLSRLRPPGRTTAYVALAVLACANVAYAVTTRPSRDRARRGRERGATTTTTTTTTRGRGSGSGTNE